MSSKFTILPQAGPKPAPPQVPRVGPSRAPWEARVSFLPPPPREALPELSLPPSRAPLLQPGQHSAQPGLPHAPGEHEARRGAGAVGHAPWQGRSTWPPAHAKQRFAYGELGAWGRGRGCYRGGSRPCATPVCPNLAWRPLPTRCDPDSWSSSPFLGTLFRWITQLGPSFCLDRLPKCKR